MEERRDAAELFRESGTLDQRPDATDIAAFLYFR
jgi:hypothetical protein